ncbi:uncharacterized protein LOC142176037 [Nicotiana tabacum]|uniref:Uncharacterized protein LOC142176037 n=1 Tax=Nicotiana tabacum TaxID=4097 RepID=A0AC58TPP4_TOBAC
MAEVDNEAPEKLSHNHPLLLNSNDNSGAILISLQLRGPENYSVWSRAMRIAILGRNKLGFIDGTCRRGKFGPNLVDLWNRCNAIVLSWIMNCVSPELSPELLSEIVYSSNTSAVWNDLKERFDKADLSRIFQIHKNIATINQGTSSISSYFSKLRHLWAEFDSLAPIPGCDCEKSREFVVFMKRLKLLQLFMGLNESHEQAKSQLLMMIPAPSVNKAYSMMMERESQRAIAHTSVPGHTRENCFKLVGYPADFKHKKKENTFPTANFAGNTGDSGTLMPINGSHDVFSAANFAVNEEATSSAKSATTGIFAFLSSIVDDRWIIDTGATNHLVGSSKLLTKLDKESSLKGPLQWAGKQSKLSFLISTTSSNKPFQLVHGNVWGPYRVPKHDGKRYFLILVDDFSRYTWIFLLNNKAETFVTVKQFLALVKNMFNSNVQTLRTYNDYEFFNSQFDELIKENGIVHQSSCVYTPQQNGVVKRKHISILNVARSLRFQGVVPLKFWGECVDTAVYLLNRLPSATLHYKSSFQMLHSHPPNLDHLKTFDYLAYASNPNITNKMLPTAIPAALMGVFLYSKRIQTL